MSKVEMDESDKLIHLIKEFNARLDDLHKEKGLNPTEQSLIFKYNLILGRNGIAFGLIGKEPDRVDIMHGYKGL